MPSGWLREINVTRYYYCCNSPEHKHEDMINGPSMRLA